MINCLGTHLGRVLRDVYKSSTHIPRLVRSSLAGIFGIYVVGLKV